MLTFPPNLAHYMHIHHFNQKSLLTIVFGTPVFLIQSQKFPVRPLTLMKEVTSAKVGHERE